MLYAADRRPQRSSRSTSARRRSRRGRHEGRRRRSIRRSPRCSAPTRAEIAITDLAVHPKTHNAYVSVMRGQGAVCAAGARARRRRGQARRRLARQREVHERRAARTRPPRSDGGRSNRRSRSRDMAFVDGKLYVAGLSNEEFASKFWAVPYPFARPIAARASRSSTASTAARDTRRSCTFVPTRIGEQPTSSPATPARRSCGSRSAT